MCNSKKTRRKFLSDSALTGAGAATALLVAKSGLADEAPELNGRKPFVLYLHLGSVCGITSGLAQPIKTGEWQNGFFKAGAKELANNPLLNSHTKQGALIFHEYNKVLANISTDVCMAIGSPESLDHRVASLMQIQGSSINSATPQWAMGVGQFSKTPANPNPMVLSVGTRTLSVPEIVLVNANSITEFKTITSDFSTIPRQEFNPIWDVLKKRFNLKEVGSTKIPDSVQPSIANQLGTLTDGLPTLLEAEADIKSLTDALSDIAFANIIKDNPDRDNVKVNVVLRDKLILAGILAKTGLASGMTILETIGDLHFGGADVDTAREGGSRWALLTLFWKWCKDNQLDEDVLVVVSHDFGRSPYNTNFFERDIITSTGKKTIVCPGRDHGLYFGMCFINKNVPSAGRIGNLLDNFTPAASLDAKGGVNGKDPPHLATHLVGSMLMKVYPHLFKTERMVRKHWPNFKEVNAILES